MLAFLETLKAQHTDDESLMALGEIEKELKAKKYGLIWEEHEEAVDVMVQTHIPVFTEAPDMEINGDTSTDRFNFLLEGDNLHSLYLLEKTHRGKIDVIILIHLIIQEKRMISVIMTLSWRRKIRLDTLSGFHLWLRG